MRNSPSSPTRSDASRDVLLQVSCSLSSDTVVSQNSRTAIGYCRKRMKPMQSGSIFQSMISEIVTYVYSSPSFGISRKTKGSVRAFKMPRIIKPRAMSSTPNDAALRGVIGRSIKQRGRAEDSIVPIVLAKRKRDLVCERIAGFPFSLFLFIIE